MPSSSEVLATIPVGMEPKWVAVGPDGTRAYVTTMSTESSPPEGAVAVIDTVTNTLTATIAVGILPTGAVRRPRWRPRVRTYPSAQRRRVECNRHYQERRHRQHHREPTSSTPAGSCD